MIKKHLIRALALTLLIVMLLSAASITMAANVSFKHTGGSTYTFNRNNVANWVGATRANSQRNVSVVQAVYYSRGYCNLNFIDGAFGNMTKGAIKDLQKAYGFPTNKQDGDCGEETWLYIYNDRGTINPRAYTLRYIL